MLRIALASVLLAMSASALADDSVNGYFRRDGTYVQPHMRSSPNSTTLDNFSTRGNTNPYTGTTGTRDPFQTYNPPSYTPPPVYQPTPIYQPQRNDIFRTR